MIRLLVVAQALAAILLGAVGLFPGLQKPGGGLNRNGSIMLLAGAIGFIAATISIQLLNDKESDRKQRRIEDLINVIAKEVMETPKGSPRSIRASPGDIITITSPGDGKKVDQRYLIEGTASDMVRDVWVVVHPIDTSSYWIQPRVSIRSDGAWSAMAYFGRSGELDKGKKFEVVAIADPQESLREGDFKDDWPIAKWASKPVVLIRR